MDATDYNGSLFLNFTLVCAFDRDFGTLKVALVLISSIVASVGCLSNFLLVYLFAKRSCREVILAFLAFFDALLCMSYGILFGNEALVVYFGIGVAYRLHYIYVIPWYVLSKAVQLVIPLILIVSSVHRWTSLTNRRFNFWSLFHEKPRQFCICSFMVVLAIAVQLPSGWAIHVRVFPDCPDPFKMFEVWPTEFGWGRTYVMYHLVITACQVAGVFVTLFVLNIAVVHMFRKQVRKRLILLQDVARRTSQVAGLGVDRGEPDIHQSRIRSVHHTLKQDIRKISFHHNRAVLSTVIIVSSYLICNSMHLTLFVLEHFAWQLITNENEDGWSPVYMKASDTVNFLFMFSSAVRIIIHFKFNRLLRKELVALLGRIRHFCQLKRSRKNKLRKSIRGRQRAFKRQATLRSIKTPIDYTTPPKRKYGMIYVREEDEVIFV